MILKLNDINLIYLDTPMSSSTGIGYLIESYIYKHINK